jgi:hypothetical protein
MDADDGIDIKKERIFSLVDLRVGFKWFCIMSITL